MTSPEKPGEPWSPDSVWVFVLCRSQWDLNPLSHEGECQPKTWNCRYSLSTKDPHVSGTGVVTEASSGDIGHGHQHGLYLLQDHRHPHESWASTRPGAVGHGYQHGFQGHRRQQKSLEEVQLFWSYSRPFRLLFCHVTSHSLHGSLRLLRTLRHQSCIIHSYPESLTVKPYCCSANVCLMANG